MRTADFILLLRKLFVGAVIAAIPLLIIIGGLRLTRILLEHRHPAADHGASPAHEANGGHGL